MDPLAAAWICVLVAAASVAVGLHRIYFKHGINIDAFASACRKLLVAGNSTRFEKLLEAVDTPVTDLVGFAWAHRHPPPIDPVGGFDGYRQALPPPTYLERMKVVLQPEVARVRRKLGRAWLWMVPGFVTVPALFVLIGPPRAGGPWVFSGISLLLALMSIPTVYGQRGQVYRALDQLVPLFERYADRERVAGR